MHILLTGAASPLGLALTEALAADGHPLRLLDAVAVDAPRRCEAVVADLTDADAVWRAVRGVEAVVHTGEPYGALPPAGPARDAVLLDQATRGTHVLCQAAVEAGARRLVYGSTLDLFRPYPEDRYLSEMWRPLPTTDMGPLSRYLGELTCREFARDHLVTITALRLGALAHEDEVVGQAPDPMWLDVRDAVQAFRAALARDACDEANWVRRWAVIHLCHTPPNPRFVSQQAGRLWAPRHHFAGAWAAAASPRDAEAAAGTTVAPGGWRPVPRRARPAAGRRKKVLLLGATGMIGPHLASGLEADYDLTLADLEPPGDGPPMQKVDVTDYGQVLAAARGHDAIVNYTVVRGDPEMSFHVNVGGAWNVMRAAAELGIGRVLHSGPEYVRLHYDHDFDVGHPPQAPGPGLYGLTKMLSHEICRVWARTHGIVTATFLFNALGPAPSAPVVGQDVHPFMLVWEDLHHACQLALEVDNLGPEHYEEFHLHSHPGPGKFSYDLATRRLGYRPTQDWTRFYRRPTPGSEPRQRRMR